MAQMNVYLSNHHGTTREAFDFYEKLFGAQRDGLIRYRDMADALKSAGMYKEEWGEKIAHTAIKFNNMTLMGSDVMAEEAPEGAPASFLVYSADSVPDADRVFAALSKGGTVLYPLEKQVWEAYDGRCIDRFGTAWEVMYEGQDL